jgi:hypothetical protein
MENKTWKFHIRAESKEQKVDKTFRFELAADDREADLFLDAVVLGFKHLDLKVGGGMVEIR